MPKKRCKPETQGDRIERLTLELLLRSKRIEKELRIMAKTVEQMKADLATIKTNVTETHDDVLELKAKIDAVPDGSLPTAAQWEEIGTAVDELVTSSRAAADLVPEG